MSEKQTTDEILKLIRLIDHNKPKLFRYADFFRGWSVVFLFVAILFILDLPITFSNASIADRVAISLSVFAILVACMSFVAPFVMTKVREISFKRLEKFVKEDEKPLLMALIEIKIAIPPAFDLEQIYKINKEMFTKEKLIEKLCD